MFDPAVTCRPVAGSTNDQPDPWRVLTVQERRVMAEVAKMKTDKEVGATLRLSAKTVRNYLDRIFGKLDVNTRTQAAMVYARGSEEI